MESEIRSGPLRLVFESPCFKRASIDLDTDSNSHYYVRVKAHQSIHAH